MHTYVVRVDSAGHFAFVYTTILTCNQYLYTYMQGSKYYQTGDRVYATAKTVEGC